MKLLKELKRITNVLYKDNLDDCEYINTAYELLSEVYKEINGEVNIQLMDGKFYKVISVELCDKIENS